MIIMADSEDDLIAVRMVNELVYCPRLFSLEGVAGLFVENHHVVDGQFAHRRVDKATGSVPSPGGAMESSGAIVGVSEARRVREARLTEVSGVLAERDLSAGRGPRAHRW